MVYYISIIDIRREYYAPLSLFLIGKIMTAAKYQELYPVQHPIGVPVSKQILMVLRRNEKKNAQVVPEVYMISDQGQSLVRDKLLLQPTDRKQLKLKTSDG